MSRSSSLDVFLRLHGQRKFAKELAASGDELEAMGLKGAKSMSVFAKSADKLKSFGKSWTRHVTLPIAGLAAVAGGMALNFKRQMGLVATDAGGTEKEVGRLEGRVISMSREFKFGAQAGAESLFHIESAGFRGAKAMKVLRESQELATTGNSDLEETTYALVSANKTLYGESVKHVRSTAAELNGIVAHGDMRLEELVGGLGSGLLAKAKAMGLSLRDVGSAMDVMTARGIKAERASYALGFTMQKLVPYGEKAENAFASIGLGEETLIKASQNGKYGYVSGLEVLEKHLDRLPTKAGRTKVLEEMFGGGRMTSGLLTDLQNLGEMRKIYGELGHEVTIYNRHVKEAKEQPLVKLETAWSGIRADLIEIGDELVPVVVPAAEDFASFSGKAAGFLEKIPGPVKAIGLATLLLTGPVATGLGFFASGVGRTLVMANKLAGASKSVTGFAWAMNQGMGLSGSSGYAFNGVGKSAALQTAKGFAYSLGPAVAAYGIGNIVTSATSGDWQDAGFEAGGAMAGGIAGFMLGGPMGAMLGVGLGSLGGELLSGLFGSSPKVNKLRTQTEALTGALHEYRESIHGVAPAESGLARARKRHTGAAQEEIEADRQLHHALDVYGESSRKTHKAQLALARAQEKVVRTGREEAAQHRLVGNRLKLFRQDSVHAVATIKQQLPTMRRRITLLNKENREGKLSHEGLEELVKLEGRQSREKHALTKVYAEAETKGGKPWAERLEKMTTLQAEYGTKGKVLITRLNETRDALSELAGASVPLVKKQYREELQEINELLGRFGDQTEGAPPARLGPESSAEHNLGVRQKRHPKHHRHRATSQEVAQRLAFPHPRRFGGSSTGNSGRGSGVPIVLQVKLDSKVIAESTTTVAKQKSLLE